MGDALWFRIPLWLAPKPGAKFTTDQAWVDLLRRWHVGEHPHVRLLMAEWDWSAGRVKAAADAAFEWAGEAGAARPPTALKTQSDKMIVSSDSDRTATGQPSDKHRTVTGQQNEPPTPPIQTLPDSHRTSTGHASDSDRTAIGQTPDTSRARDPLPEKDRNSEGETDRAAQDARAPEPAHPAPPSRASRPAPHRPRETIILEARSTSEDDIDFRTLVDGRGNAHDLAQALAYSGIESVDELATVTEDAFSRRKGVGPQRARDIGVCLRRFGRSYAAPPPPPSPKLTKHQEAMAELARLASADSTPLQEIDQWLLQSASTTPSTPCSPPDSATPPPWAK